MDKFWSGLLLGIALLGCLQLNQATPQNGGNGLLVRASSLMPPICSDSGICLCPVDYRLKVNLCEPICSRCGVNRECVRPGVCECIEGYENNSKGECEPKCTPSCGQHGDCQLGNVCECHAGYFLLDGTCQAACPPDCEPPRHCEEPDVCSCARGFDWHDELHRCLPENIIPSSSQNLNCSMHLQWWIVMIILFYLKWEN